MVRIRSLALLFQATALFSCAGLAQIQTFTGVNGGGHQSMVCHDRDGDGYGVGPLALINTTATTAIAAGTQTITPGSMSGGTLTGNTTVNSPVVVMPAIGGVQQTLDALQTGEGVSGTGIPAGTTVTGVAYGVPAELTLGTGNSGLTFVAQNMGTGGNGISVALINPGTANAPLSVTVSSSAVTVHLATDSSSQIASTAAQVQAAIQGSNSALTLVTPGLLGSGAGMPSASPATSLSGGSWTTPSITLSQAAMATNLSVAMTMSIGVGTVLRYDLVQNMERVVVTAVTATSFTANFLLPHASGATISDQGCLGWDADDNDPLVWNQMQAANKYESGSTTSGFPNFRKKLANDLLLDSLNPGSTVPLADAQAAAATLSNPTHIYYVAPASASPAGSDSNSGSGCTITAPCLTISGVISAGYHSSSSGVLIFARNGWDNPISLYNGTSSNAAVFMSYPGELAAPTGFSHKASMTDTSWFYIRDVRFLGGAVIEGGTTTGGQNPPSITFHDGIFQDIDARGPFGDDGGINGFDMTNITVEDSAFYDDWSDQHGIYMGSRTYQSTGVTLQRNLLHHNVWNGLHWNGRCSGCMVQQNVAFANGVSGLDFEMGFNHSTIRDNLVFSNAKQITFYEYESGQCPSRVANLDFTGTTTASSATITGIASNIIAYLNTGDVVKGPGIPNGSTISGIGTNQITLNNNATASASTTLADEEHFTSSTAVIICPYDENYNIIANNTTVSTGNDASNTLATPQIGCPAGFADCQSAVITFSNTTEAAVTNSQTQAGQFDHETIVNNIFDGYGNNNANPPVSFTQNNDANDPTTTAAMCDSNCQNWMATDTLVDNEFYQNDGKGGMSIVSTAAGNSYSCTTAAAVLGTASGASFSGCLFGNPQFADAQNSYYLNDARFDFRLLSTAPALHAGTTTNVPPYDLAGRAYLDDLPSIGALERNKWNTGWNDLGSATQVLAPANGAPNYTNNIGFGGTGGTCNSGTQTSCYPFQTENTNSFKTWADCVNRETPGRIHMLVCADNGGHTDFIGNQINAFEYNVASPTFVAITQPSTYIGDPGTGATFSATVSGGAITGCSVISGGSGYIGTGGVIWIPTGGDTVTTSAHVYYYVASPPGPVTSCYVASNGGGAGYIHAPNGITGNFTTPALTYGNTWGVCPVTGGIGAPTGSCTSNSWYYDSVGLEQYECISGSWGTGAAISAAVVPELADGTPSSRHVTGLQSYSPVEDRMVQMNGAVAGGNGPHFQDSWALNFGSGTSATWHRLDPTCASCGTSLTIGSNMEWTHFVFSGFSGHAVYNPLNDTHFVYLDNGGGYMTVFSESTGNWIYAGAGGIDPGGAASNNGFGRAIIPDRQRAYFIGSNGTSSPNYQGSWVDLTKIPSPGGGSAETVITSVIPITGAISCAGWWRATNTNTQYYAPSLEWDQAIGQFVAFIASGTGTYWTMDPDSYNCNSYNLTGGPALTDAVWMFGRFRYSPAVDAFVVYPGYNSTGTTPQDAFVLSLNAPDPGPAGTPTVNSVYTGTWKGTIR